MNEIASPGQLRLSFLRRALFVVPVIVLLGFLSGKLSDSGYGNRWFAALVKPDIMPPGWVFPVAWTSLYILMGLSLAMVLHARGAQGRGGAIALFVAQFLCNLAWSPLFFDAHKVGAALVLILILIVLVAVTIALFWRIRTAAGLMLVPYLLWLLFAATLNYQIGQLNPGAETLVAPGLHTQI